MNWFCYPSGHYNATVIAAVKGAGYTGSTTVVPGWAQPQRRPLPPAPAARARRDHAAEALLAQIAGIREDPPAPASYNGT